MIVAAGLAGGRGGAEAIRAVGLRAEVGEIVAVVGRSGVGKTTLLRLLAGLDRPTAGTVEGGPCALMPQGDALLPWRSVVANATVAARLEGRPAAAATAEARALLARFGLGAVADARPATLSGGMRRRVALLRTVLAGRPVLLLDEPFGSLDAATRDELATWLRSLLAEEPRAVVLVTHDVDEAVDLAARILVLGGGPPAGVVSTVVPAALGAVAARAAVHAALLRPLGDGGDDLDGDRDDFDRGRG